MKKTTNEYEHKYWPEAVIGIDEAGRGPLAGPLVVAGVIFPSGYENDDIYDSKGLSEKRREQLFEIIKEDALEYEILIISSEEIDKVNILNATKNGMFEIGKALNGNIVLTDAVDIKIDNKIVIPIVKGDQKSISIAAASILAKVTRDNIMKKYHLKYPEYGFDKNKGYPTKKHLEALEKYGVLDIHRKTYGPIIKLNQLKLDL